MLKARLAATESMTHDVIRDLLGVKLNMKNYAVSLYYHKEHLASHIIILFEVLTCPNNKC